LTELGVLLNDKLPAMPGVGSVTVAGAAGAAAGGVVEAAAGAASGLAALCARAVAPRPTTEPIVTAADTINLIIILNFGDSYEYSLARAALRGAAVSAPGIGKR
jgi:hypothetical protein